MRSPEASSPTLRRLAVLTLLAAVAAAGGTAAVVACGGTEDSPSSRGVADRPLGEGGTSAEGGAEDAAPPPAKTCRLDDAFGTPQAVGGLDGLSLGSPAVSGDERTVYWFGAADGGGQDLWLARRAERTAPFGTAERLAEVSTPANETDPRPSNDGLRLYFASDRGGGFGLFVATRAAVTAPFGAAEAVLALPGQAFHPSLAGETGALYAATTEADGGAQIVRVDARFRGAPASLVVPLATAADETHPTASDDDDGLYFERRTADGGVVLLARRDGPDGGFGEPRLRNDVPLGASPSTLTPDGCRLYVLQAGKLAVLERAPR